MLREEVPVRTMKRPNRGPSGELSSRSLLNHDPIFTKRSKWLLLLLALITLGWFCLSLILIASEVTWLHLFWPYLALLVVAAAGLIAIVSSSLAYLRRAERSRDPGVMFLARLIVSKWQAVVAVIITPMVLALLVELRDQAKTREAESAARAQAAGQLLESWSALRSALILFSASCDGTPGGRCDDHFKQIVTQWVRASWVLPLHIHNIRSHACASGIGGAAALSAKFFCFGPTPAASAYASGRTEACKQLADSTLMANSSAAYRKFLYAYSVPARNAQLSEALAELHASTRALGCALLYAGSPAEVGSGNSHPLHACFCSSSVLADTTYEDKVCSEQAQKDRIEDLHVTRWFPIPYRDL